MSANLYIPVLESVPRHKILDGEGPVQRSDTTDSSPNSLQFAVTG